MDKEYYYNETVTRFYDPVYDRILNKSGLEFYLQEISGEKSPVLEAGAGTGRVFVPALQSGADIYGIDYSEQMLGRLREKISEKDYHRLSVQDMRSFSLERKFSLVISPFRVFQHLLTVDDQLKALVRIYEHLESGGRLIFDVFCPDLKRLINDADNVPEFDGEYENGKKLQRFASIKYDNINQILNLTFKFVWDENGGQKTDEFSTPLRYYHRFELENLIARTKFKLENIYGDFKRSKLTNDSKEFVVVCRK
jgi:SAM-dependent methyltransferase